jgi:hypothetical protein
MIFVQRNFSWRQEKKEQEKKEVRRRFKEPQGERLRVHAGGGVAFRAVSVVHGRARQRLVSTFPI